MKQLLDRNAELATNSSSHFHWLKLQKIPKLGQKLLRKLMDEYSDPQDIFQADVQQLQTIGLHDSIIHSIRHFPSEYEQQAEDELNWLSQNACHVLCLQDLAYPEILKQIPDPPPLLFIAGNVQCLKKPQIAIVGSRNPTPGGKESAYEFAAALVNYGLSITSGMALGIDGYAHSGALNSIGLENNSDILVNDKENNSFVVDNSVTIGVLGSGLDVIYPESHRQLAEKIIENGALVSEFPLGTLPHPGHFPRRNRLISGLSAGVLVVEAALKSGSLITARMALEQGREVFAIPGSIHNALSKGCHRLIRDGAKLVETVDDILEEMHGCISFQQQTDQQFSGAARSAEFLTQGLSEQELLVFEQVDHELTPIDIIIERTGLPSHDVSILLTQLELKGVVTNMLGGYSRYCK